MKTTLTLSESELVIAVKEYVKKRGHKPPTRVVFSQEGFPDSPDPREQGVSFLATMEVETK